MANKEYLSIPEVAKILGISRIAIYKKVKKGEIKAAKIGRSYAIPKKYLEDIIVKEKYRGMKIGKLLFEAVIIKSREAGAKRMQWQVLDWNTPAIAFYESLGAKVMKEWLTMRVTGPDLEKLCRL